MRELPIIDDKRLLGALDYIDERFVAEVTEEYEIFDTAPGAKLPPRARMYRFRQFAALAACLLLLSFASLGVNYVANAVISFAASAGGSNTETNVDEQDSEHIDSPYERAIDAYPEGMSAEEIYADVLKGGWCVTASTDRSGFIVGGDLWYSFFEKTQKGESASVLLAHYSPDFHRDDIDEAVIFLKEIFYDGNEFHFRMLFSATDEVVWHGEYKFLKTGKSEHLSNGETVFEEAFYLTNSDIVTWSDLRGHFWSAMYAPEIELYNEQNYLIIHFIK